MSAQLNDAGIRLILNVDAITPPLTGIGRYALRLAQGAACHPAISDVRYFSAYKWVDNPANALEANTRIARMRRYVPAKSMAMRAYFSLRQSAFNRLARRLDRYVLHSPNYLLFEHGGPCVTTVHDLSWLHFPEFHPMERVRIMNRLMPRSLEIADAVITDSTFVKTEVIDRFGIDPQRVHAIPLGVDEIFIPRTAAETITVLSRYGLTHGRYLLALATFEPRKNLARLIEAHARLDVSLRRANPLVLAGAVGWHSDELVHRIDAMAARGEVKRLGFIPEGELPLLLSGARALAFPSIYEGFGLPPLEAMASGVPVVASLSSSIPEVIGDAGLLVAPEDVEGMTAAIERALTDEAWRTAAIERGLVRAQRFTWQSCVDSTIDVYRHVMSPR